MRMNPDHMAIAANLFLGETFYASSQIIGNWQY